MLGIVGDELTLDGDSIARLSRRLCARDEDALGNAIERANTPPPDFDAWRDLVIAGLSNAEVVEMAVDRGLLSAIEEETHRRREADGF